MTPALETIGLHKRSARLSWPTTSISGSKLVHAMR